MSRREESEIDTKAEYYSLLIAVEFLERAYISASVSPQEYSDACLNLISQFKTLSNSLKIDIQSFMHCPAALKRLNSGVPATFEHLNSTSNTSHIMQNQQKYVAEAVQLFITLMDSIKLLLLAKDQIHPLLADLILALNKVTSLTDENYNGKVLVKKWLVLLNGMNAVDELDESQSRQLLFDLESAHTEFHRHLDS